MKRVLTTLIAVLIAVPLMARQHSASDLVQRGLLLERAEGNVKAAIALYERAITEFGTKATETSTVNAIATARARLAALTQKAAVLTERIIPDGQGHAVSPDGRYITLTDWDTGDLAIRELGSGRIRRVSTHGKWSGDFAASGMPSPDSRSIVYSWFVEKTGGYELRIVGRDGGPARTLHVEAGASTWPVGWAPDGKLIFAVIDRDTPRPDASAPIGFTVVATPGRNPVVAVSQAAVRELVSIAVSDGQIRTLKQFTPFSGGRFQMNLVVSPDGRSIAYNLRPVPGNAQRDVHILSLATGQESLAIGGPADDNILGWFPDGQRLLFASDREGTVGIWATGLNSATTPTSVRKDAGTVTSMGFTKAGQFYYVAQRPRENDVHVATLNPQTGMRDQPPSPLKGRYINTKTQPAWSPSGDRIAYIRTPSGQVLGPVRNHLLVLHAVATGEEKEWSTSLQNMQNPTWLPDGNAVIVQGRDAEGNQGLHQIDIRSGALKTLARRSTEQDINRNSPAVSPDGRRVYFRWIGAKAETGISHLDLTTGAEQTIVRRPVSAFALSPDGTSIVTLETSGVGTGYVLRRFPATGGEGEPLAGTEREWNGTVLAWSADGRAVFVVKANARGQDVWSVPIDGAAPINTGLTSSSPIQRLATHPDGRSVALGISRQSIETRVLENFPALKSK